MKTYLVTFGVGTVFKGKCLILTSDNEEKVREYAYDHYGRLNISSFYDYEEKKDIIKTYNYEILEIKSLWFM